MFCEIGLFVASLAYRERAVSLLRSSLPSGKEIVEIVRSSRTTIREGSQASRAPAFTGSSISIPQNVIYVGAPDLEEAERTFQTLVRDKHVTLVGGSAFQSVSVPADARPRSTTVVQLKLFAGTEGLWNSEDHTPEADIVYYVGRHARKIEELFQNRENINAFGLNKTKVLVFLSGPPRIAMPIPTRALRFNPHLLLGSCQIGQRAVLDLLVAEPASLTVRGFDGYLRPQVHHRFRDELSHRTNYLRALNSFSGHDLFGNRELLQGLWRDGLLVPDDQTSEYLNLTNVDYATQLEVAMRVQFGSDGMGSN